MITTRPARAPSWSRGAKDWVEYPCGMRESREAIESCRDSFAPAEAVWKRVDARVRKRRKLEDPRETLKAISEVVDGLLAKTHNADSRWLSGAFAHTAAEIFGFELVMLAWRPAGSTQARRPLPALVDDERRYSLSAFAPRECVLRGDNTLLLTVDMLARRAELGPEHGLVSAPGAFMLIG